MTPTNRPTKPEDVAVSTAVAIARLLVRSDWTIESYHRQRDYVNTLPGVRIVELPRDREFRYALREADL